MRKIMLKALYEQAVREFLQLPNESNRLILEVRAKDLQAYFEEQ